MIKYDKHWNIIGCKGNYIDVVIRYFSRWEVGLIKYDVIVVGAGPAGSTAGAALAEKGLAVLLLEKEKLPRYKPCGGALSLKISDIMKYDISEYVEDTITKVTFGYKGEKKLTISSPDPVCYMVMRDKFDYFLVEKAKQAGVHFIEGQKVDSVVIDTFGVKVYTGEKTYESSYLIGADGINGVVGRSLGLIERKGVGITLESEILVSPEIMNHYKGSVLIDYGHIPLGYGWIFPKKDHLSVGVGSFAKKIKSFNDYYLKFLHQESLFGVGQTLRSKGYPIPTIGTNRQKRSGYRVALVGDAAGLVDPLSGEGIYFAIRSGQLAAQVLIKAAGKNSMDFSEYEELVRKEILDPFKIAYQVSKIFYPFSGMVHRLMCRNKGFAMEILQVIYGKSTYDKLYKSFFKQWRYMLPF